MFGMYHRPNLGHPDTPDTSSSMIQHSEAILPFGEQGWRQPHAVVSDMDGRRRTTDVLVSTLDVNHDGEEPRVN